MHNSTGVHQVSLEDIYENVKTIERNNAQQQLGYQSHIANLLMPPCAPPPASHKSIELAELHEELARYKRDNKALRDKLEWTNKRYEDIVKEMQAKLFVLEKERESTFSRSAFESRTYDATMSPPAQSEELKRSREETLNLKAVLVTYAEDVGNINKQLSECQRAKNILSREAQERNEKIKRLEDEVASLSYLLKDCGAGRDGPI